MTYIIIAIFIIACLFVKFCFNRSIQSLGIFVISGILIYVMILGIDYIAQTADSEVWSGRITDVYHKEEWNEWHPSYTTTSTDGKGHTTVTVHPGYMEHHPAENSITTSDNGEQEVDTAPNGRDLDDTWPNTTAELEKLYPVGTPTASVHEYENKVQASYSLFKHKNINIDDYKLPNYPDKVTNIFDIDRIVGWVPNKPKALVTLANWNSELNKTIVDPKTSKHKSWKEVNLIFVNLSGQNRKAAFALQDKWENGNKNDFIVSFSLKNGKFEWVYPFSWSDKQETLIDVRDYMMDLNDKGIKDFSPVIDGVSKIVADKFVRKQMAEFNYLQIEPSETAEVIAIIILILGIIGYFLSDKLFDI